MPVVSRSPSLCELIAEFRPGFLRTVTFLASELQIVLDSSGFVWRGRYASRGPRGLATLRLVVAVLVPAAPFRSALGLLLVARAAILSLASRFPPPLKLDGVGRARVW